MNRNEISDNGWAERAVHKIGGLLPASIVLASPINKSEFVVLRSFGVSRKVAYFDGRQQAVDGVSGNYYTIITNDYNQLNFQTQRKIYRNNISVFLSPGL